MNLMKFIALLTISILVLTGCSEEQVVQTEQAEYNAPPVPANWPEAQDKRRRAIAEYMTAHKTEYDWFTKHTFSEHDGVPFIIMKLMPIVAPELWGSKENFLDVAGLFIDERDPGYPIARGIGISAFNREKLYNSQIDYSTFTCGACHVGRVRGEDGKLSYLDGGINTEFNVVQYRVRAYRTLEKIFNGETDQAKQQALALAAFKKALVKVQQTNPTYFYNKYKNDKVDLNEEYEKSQINLFLANADAIVARFIAKTTDDFEGFSKLLDNNYKSIRDDFLVGFPGMVDASGVNTTTAYIKKQKEGLIPGLLAYFVLPPTPGITDFMAVWEQGKRRGVWDETKTKLHGGGGQWNGNIPIPVYRNLAAQLSMGLDKNDIRVPAYTAKFISKLPAPIYPFEVDLDLARKGQKLFKENCVDCHRPNNDTVYNNLGTNMDRAHVINSIIRGAAVGLLKQLCSEKTVVKMYGQDARPCAEYDGVSLAGKDDIIMPPPDKHIGYNALPLGGIWAQAPYLHNGSVPTMYHLLVPKERPTKFIKSRLSYDKSLMGFAWSRPTNAPQGKSMAYIFDTTSFATFNRSGHDKDIKQGNKTYKLDWSDDIEGAKALIEYLKTF